MWCVSCQGLHELIDCPVDVPGTTLILLLELLQGRGCPSAQGAGDQGERLDGLCGTIDVFQMRDVP